MENSIILAIKKYMEGYPEFENFRRKISVDYLNDKDYSISIEPIPTNPVIGGYIGGLIHKQYPFIFAINFPYSNEAKMNIENSSFFEDFSKWIENNSYNNIFPDLPNDYTADGLKVTSSGFLFGVTSDLKTGRYQMQLNLTYWTMED